MIRWQQEEEPDRVPAEVQAEEEAWDRVVNACVRIAGIKCRTLPECPACR